MNTKTNWLLLVKIVQIFNIYKSFWKYFLYLVEFVNPIKALDNFKVKGRYSMVFIVAKMQKELAEGSLSHIYILL